MNKKISAGLAISAAVVLSALSLPARAEFSDTILLDPNALSVAAAPQATAGQDRAAAPQAACRNSLAEVQANWDKMGPMPMETSRDSELTVADDLRLAKWDCAKGDVAGAQAYLNIVRRHLGMPEHAVPHDRD